MVKAEDVRKFCGRECARRAMFVKVQLNEVPAWERRGGAGKGGEMELLVGEIDGERSGTEKVRRKVESLAVGDENGKRSDGETVRKQMQELAVERGEGSTTMRQQGLLKEGVVEESTTRLPRPPDAASLGNEEGSSIEGYAPRRLPDRSRRNTAESDDEDDALDLL